MKRKQFVLAALAFCLTLLMLTAAASAEETETAELMGTFGGAVPISVNEERTGRILTEDDSYYYLFSLDEPGAVSVSFIHDFVESTDEYWSVSLYAFDNISDEFFTRSFRGSERNEVKTPSVGLPAGSYYLCIKPYESWKWSNAAFRFTVNYQVSSAWEKERNDSFSTASVIPVNQQIHGSSMNENDVDRYLIELPEAGSITLQFSHDYVETSDNLWTLSLYEYNDIENNLFSMHFVGSKRGALDAPCVGLPAGKYYICVTPYQYWQWSDVNYSIMAQFTSSDAWENESNGSRKTATTIFFNKEVRGSMMSDSDEDFYMFTLAKEDAVSLSFGHEYVDSTNEYWSLSLYNESDLDNTVFSAEYIGAERDNLESGEITLSPGVYYVRITNIRYWDWSSAPYTLTVNAKSQEGTPQPFVQKYIIDGITVSNTNGKALSAIPDKDFLATVTVTNLTGGGESWVLLASYTKEGQFVDFTWARTKNFSVGGTFDLTVPIRNPSGKIGQLKAFTVASLSDLTPLGNSASFPAV